MDPAERAWREGDLGTLLAEVEDVVRATAQNYYVPGMEFDDVRQELRYAILRGFARHYDPARGSVRSFAKVVANRWALTLLRLSQADRRKTLDTARSTDEVDPRVGIELQLVSPLAEPEAAILVRERFEEVCAVVDDRLSDLERDALRAKIAGFSYEEISDRTGYSKKAIDNALQRAWSKLQKDLVLSTQQRSKTYAIRRETNRTDGFARGEAERYFGTEVVAAVRTPEGRVIVDRRSRYRRKDPNLPVWVNVAGAPGTVRGRAVEAQGDAVQEGALRVRRAGGSRP